MPHYGTTLRTGKEAIVRVIGLIIIFLAIPTIADERAKECVLIKEKIRYIQSKMRSGYTRAQGERMEAELRRLRERRRRTCR